MDDENHPFLKCLRDMRRIVLPLPQNDTNFHRYNFASLRCHETRKRTHAELIAQIEQRDMKPLPGFVFGTRERISYAGEGQRIDIYLRHDDEGEQEPALETVEYFPHAIGML